MAWGHAVLQTVFAAREPCPQQKHTRTSRLLHQSCAVGFTRRTVILKESRGQNPKDSLLKAMSIKPLFISTLSLTLRIGAVTHEKNQLIEQGNQEAGETKELAHHSSLPGGKAFHPTFYESNSFGDAANYWSRWTD